MKSVSQLPIIKLNKIKFFVLYKVLMVVLSVSIERSIVLKKPPDSRNGSVKYDYHQVHLMGKKKQKSDL